MTVGGARGKLTPARQELILKYIREGNYIQTACKAAGIDVTTLSTWISKGKEQQSGRYYEFWQALEKAEAESERLALAQIQIASQGPLGDWRASLEFLSRRFRDRWANSASMKVEGQIGVGPSKDMIEAMLQDPVVVERIAENFRRRAGELSANAKQVLELEEQIEEPN